MKDIIIFVGGMIFGGVIGFCVARSESERSKNEVKRAKKATEDDIPTEFKRRKKESKEEPTEMNPKRKFLSKHTEDFEEAMASIERPSDDDPDDLTDADVMGYDEEVTMLNDFDHEMTKNDPCKRISTHYAESLPERFEMVELLYFVIDDVVTDEDLKELEVGEREELVPGYVLDEGHFTDSGFTNKEVGDYIFILNPKYDRVYRVGRVEEKLSGFKEV